jgi:probable HAF family extracellular repeat protein
MSRRLLPQSAYTLASQINNLGQYVGAYSTNFDDSHGFLFSGGSYQTIDPPGESQTQALGVNDHGEVVGLSNLPGMGTVGFSFQNGQFTTITGPSGSAIANANGVNNAGAIVGSYLVDNQSIFELHSFLLQNGQYTLIDDPNAVLGNNMGTYASDISNNGEIVGSYYDASGLTHGFIYQNGVYTTLDDPLGVGGTLLSGVNDVGQIVGQYTDASGTTFAFVATPAPEPSSAALVAAVGFT